MRGSKSIFISLTILTMHSCFYVLAGPLNRGCDNASSSCFLNASMQMLSHIKPLVDFLAMATKDKQYKEGSVADLVYKHFDNLNSKNGTKSFNPRTFREAIAKTTNLKDINDMKDYSQHDARDLISYIICSLIEEPEELETLQNNLHLAISSAKLTQEAPFLNSFFYGINVITFDAMQKILEQRILEQKRKNDLYEIANALKNKNQEEIRNLFEQFLLKDYGSKELIGRLNLLMSIYEEDFEKFKELVENYKNYRDLTQAEKEFKGNLVYQDNPTSFYYDMNHINNAKKVDLNDSDIEKIKNIVEKFDISQYKTIWALKNLFEYKGLLRTGGGDPLPQTEKAMFLIQFDSNKKNQNLLSTITQKEISTEDEKNFKIESLIYSNPENKNPPTLTFTNLPSILIFTLYRLKKESPDSETLVKDTCNRKLFEKITFKTEDKDESFDLVGIIIHDGDIRKEMDKKEVTGGHYWAVAKSYIDKEWYKYNDATVSPLKKNDIETIINTGNDGSGTAYILAYQKAAPRPNPLQTALALLKAKLLSLAQTLKS